MRLRQGGCLLCYRFSPSARYIGPVNYEDMPTLLTGFNFLFPTASTAFTRPIDDSITGESYIGAVGEDG